MVEFSETSVEEAGTFVEFALQEVALALCLAGKLNITKDSIGPKLALLFYSSREDFISGSGAI